MAFKSSWLSCIFNGPILKLLHDQVSCDLYSMQVSYNAPDFESSRLSVIAAAQAVDPDMTPEENAEVRCN